MRGIRRLKNNTSRIGLILAGRAAHSKALRAASRLLLVLLTLWTGASQAQQTFLVFHEDRCSVITNLGGAQDRITGMSESTNSVGVVSFTPLYAELYHGNSETHYLTLRVDAGVPSIVDGTTYSAYTLWQLDADGYLFNNASGTTYYLYIDVNVDPRTAVKVTATKAEASTLLYHDDCAYAENAAGAKFYFNYKNNGGSPYWEAKDAVTSNRSSEATIVEESARLLMGSITGDAIVEGNGTTKQYALSSSATFQPAYLDLSYVDVKIYDLVSYMDYYIDGTGTLQRYERFYTVAGTGSTDTATLHAYVNASGVALNESETATNASGVSVVWSVRRSDGTAAASTIDGTGKLTYNSDDEDYSLIITCTATKDSYTTSRTFVVNNNEAPVIGGSVYGGGRMADVEENTHVYIYNCGENPDRTDGIGIEGVYGGNDISGSVKGSEGSFVQIGDPSQSIASFRVGSVYGGGNGNYEYAALAGTGTATNLGMTYNYTYNASNATLQTKQVNVVDGTDTRDDGCGSVTVPTRSVSSELVDVETFTESCTLVVPSIQRTHVVVNSDMARIDSLFGGARAAYINVPSSDPVAIDVDIQLGTIYSVFGGNNLGGEIRSITGATVDATNVAKVDIAVTGTTVTPVDDAIEAIATPNHADPTDKNYYSEEQLGTDHGIKYLFGGGNKVVAPHVAIGIYGGQIDTVFAGGNSATVSSTAVTVNCTADPLGDGTLQGGSTIYGTRFSSDGISQLPGYRFNALDERGNIYNVRALFGGNNAEHMDGLPTLNLVKGGIGTVYGGGNSGNMRHNTVEPTLAHATGDTILGTYIVLSSDDINIDYLYGGCQKASVDYATYIWMDGGHVGNIYGGCNISGDVGSWQTNGHPGSYVYIAGGHIYSNIYGGANGYYHCNDLTTYLCGRNLADPEYYVGLRIPTLSKAVVRMWNGTAWGNIYGGGRLANVGFGSLTIGGSASNLRQYDFTGSGHTADYNSGSVVVRIEGSPLLKGDVYGGGDMASIFGTALVFIDGSPTIKGSVYSGNDKRGTIMGSGTSDLTLDGATLTASNGDRLTAVNASSYVQIKGTPDIYAVYGGGNGNYDYSELNLCQEYSGNNLPVQVSSYVDINTTATTDGRQIQTVYGGGNGVTVSDSVTVLINSGDYTTSALPREATSHTAQVARVFGGNNNASMNILPNIKLEKGLVGDVFGGSNKGQMTGNGIREGVESLSTYVLLNSELFFVQGSIYAGCDQADVTNGTYVHVHDGVVNLVFGGNDKAGEIGGTSRVEVTGGTVVQLYGGGNGSYDYIYDSYHGNCYTVKKYGSTDSDPVLATRVSGMPTSHNTSVMLKGGTIENNVYGGGLAGNCRNTSVVVDGTAKVLSNIFGGGQGILEEMGICTAEHRGNVHDEDSEGNAIGNTVVELRSVGEGSTVKRVFGGGQAGDVDNTNVILYPTFTHHIEAIYAGCVASDVKGTASANISAPKPHTGFQTSVDTVYGGNDFSGRVENTDVTINSGTFYCAFGAGNGEYEYLPWFKNKFGSEAFASGGALEGKVLDTVPYSMHVRMTINDKDNPLSSHDTATIFLGNVYGGGNMGLVGNKYITGYTPGSGYIVERPDCSLATPITPDTTMEDIYGDVVLTIHGGSLQNKVFGGARGISYLEENYMAGKRFFGRQLTETERSTITASTPTTDPISRKDHMQLVYGYKQVNVDGGSIYHTLHGGSEYIDDGYYWECQGTDTTTYTDGKSSTMRPSSVINLTGGTVNKSVYGAGYEGTVYGSVYVNVGTNAVAESQVWKRGYGSAIAGTTSDRDGSTGVRFASYKPRLVASVSQPADLKTNNLMIASSIYNGSDWGSAGAMAVFSTPGIYGGESRILIDGRGYYTDDRNAAFSDEPPMQITQSIIGAGTSTEGGDIFRFIHFRNYGSSNCRAANNEIYSIQRADLVILDSVYLALRGEQDRISASVSPDYSFCRVDTLTLRNDNFIAISTPAIFVGHMRSERRGPDYPYGLINDLYNVDSRISVDGCADPCNLYASSQSKNVLMMGGGAYVMVLPFKADPSNPAHNINATYGPVEGYAYFGMSDESMGYVFARRRVVEAANPVNEEDGGFWTECATSVVQGNEVEKNYTGSGKELVYENFNGSHPDAQADEVGGASFRSWQVGDPVNSERARSIIIIANDHPEDNPTRNFKIADTDPGTADDWVSWSNGGTDYHRYAYAVNTSPLQLPPSKAGNYFTIESLVVDNDQGGQISLIEAAWNPNKDPFSPYPASSTSGWVLSQSAPTTLHDGAAIETDPTHTFGLLLRPHTDNTADQHGNFTNTCHDASFTRCNDPLVLADNGWFTRNDSYFTPTVEQATLFPTMDFILTYNTDFSTTVTRNVRLRMREFDQNGNALAPVWVTLTISTVMRDFKKEINLETWAMYNGGISNDYGRKVILPATFKRRQIFLSNVEWHQSGEGEERVMTPSDAVARGLYVKQTGSEYTFTKTQVSGSVKATSTNSGSGEFLYIKDIVGTDTTWTDDPTGHTAALIVSNNEGCENAFYMHSITKGTMPTYKDFAFTVTPTTYVTENLGNTLGWYDINRGAVNSIDLFTDAGNDESMDACADIRKTNGTSGQALNHEVARTGSDLNELLNYSDKGIAIGTLDGRATAGLDINMRYNGNLNYDDCSSVGKVTMTFSYQGTTVEDKGEFKVIINVRTRTGGDTIYVATTDVLQRNGQTIAQYGALSGTTLDEAQRNTRRNEVLSWTASQYVMNNTLPDYKYGKRPDRFLGSFEEALSSGMFREGDVIAILDEVELKGSENVTPHGMDESNFIQIIRYSGSHYTFPGKACAYRGPLITVKDSAMLTMYNVWFNGSGLTRVKTKRTDGTLIEHGPKVAAADGGYYYENDLREADTLFAHAPIIWVQDKGTLNLSYSVRMMNNFSNADGMAYVQHASPYTAGEALPQQWKMFGGAIGMRGKPAYIDGGVEHAAWVPQATLGSDIFIYDNIIVDHREAYTDAQYAAGGVRDADFYYKQTKPVNHGAGVYVDGGRVHLGSLSNGNLINIRYNYYWNPALHVEGDKTYASVGTTEELPTPFAGHGKIDFNTYTHKTGGKTISSDITVCGESASSTGLSVVNEYKMVVDSIVGSAGSNELGFPSFSNIFLTRTTQPYSSSSPDDQMLAGFDATVANIDDYKTLQVDGRSVYEHDYIERHDDQTDFVVFESQLNPSSAIGISKWFPGGDPSYKRAIRDTIFFAISDGIGAATNAEYVHRSKIFFADSTDFGVDTFYNSRISSNHIYLHRCATFMKKQHRDSVEYRIYVESECPDGMDSLFIKVQGGLPGYTFDWYLQHYDEDDTDGDVVIAGTKYKETNELRRHTYKAHGYNEDDEVLDPVTNAVIRNAYRDKTTGMLGALVAKDTARLTALEELRGSQNNRVFRYRVVMNDISYKCPLTQDVEIMVKKLESTVEDYHVKTSYDHTTTVGSVAVDDFGRNLIDKLPYEGYYTSISKDYESALATLGGNIVKVTDDGRGNTSGSADQILVYNDSTGSGTRQLQLHHYPAITIDGNAIDDEREWLYHFGYLPDGNADSVPKYILHRDYEGNMANMYWVPRYANASKNYVPGMIRGHGRTCHVDGPARFIREYHGYHLYAVVQPEPRYGYVSRRDYDDVPIDSRVLLCPGNVVKLNTCTPYTDNLNFVFWDFDPQSPASTEYVIRNSDATVAAFYSPFSYWWETVTTQPAEGYHVNYRGTVTITNEEGLAWLISTVNGLNGQQAQDFVFDTIYIAPGEYDMQAHRWTPLGTAGHPFRGIFKRAERDPKTFDPYPADKEVHINDIIVDEEELPYVGFFGCVDSAQIEGFTLHREFLVGHNYVGGLAARAVNHTRVSNVGLHNGNFSGTNVVGAMIGYGKEALVENCILGVRAVLDGEGNLVRYDGEAISDQQGLNWGDASHLDSWVKANPSCNEDFVTGGRTDLVYVGSNDQIDLSNPPDESDPKYSGEGGAELYTKDTLQFSIYKALYERFQQEYSSVEIIGDAIYAGGLFGQMEDCEGRNNHLVVNGTNSRALYFGGFAGMGKGVVNGESRPRLLRRLFSRRKAADQTVVSANNYIRISTSDNGNLRVGGLVGTASDTRMSNNYVYGDVRAASLPASLVAITGNNVSLDHCYYNDGLAGLSRVGSSQGSNNRLEQLSEFSGSGSNVTMSRTVYGVNNLTRALNLWVAEQKRQGNDVYSYWHGDYRNVNAGYPIHGAPEIVPVTVVDTVESCGDFELDGQRYDQSGRISFNTVDSALFVDSTYTVVLTINHGTTLTLSDSLQLGDDYSRYGFSLLAEDLQSILSQTGEEGAVRTVQLVDSLLTVHGCDSVVMLNLYVFSTPLGDTTRISAYPNPTLSTVTVEADGLQKIEVYQADGRRLQERTASADIETVDLSRYPSGAYYLRVTTKGRVAVRKVIKK